MKLAAVDIGSNAARLYIANVIERDGVVLFKKIHYMRYPLQLGKDVFLNGKITKPKYKEILELVAVLKDINKLYKVDGYLACATSAMREATNGIRITERILEKTKFKINVINGGKEASYLSSVLQNFINDEKNVIHIDVGGGSTELNIYNKGQKVNSESFDIGSVRDFKDEKSLAENKRMQQWISDSSKKTKIDYAIGTGGNIRKLQKLSFYGINEPLDLEHLIETRDKIESFSYIDRIEKLLLNPDRADVIIPASDIYIEVMKLCKVDIIEVPDIGLKDGIMLDLYQSMMFK